MLIFPFPDRPRAEPPPDEEVTPELLALRDELFALKRDEAKAQMPRFRSLCDADGYPLVGNAVSKKSMLRGYQFFHGQLTLHNNVWRPGRRGYERKILSCGRSERRMLRCGTR